MKSKTVLIAGVLAVATVLSLTAVFIFPAEVLLQKASDKCLAKCEERPHVECIGMWNISGEYPDCVCSFLCNEDNVITAEGREVLEGNDYYSLLRTHGFDLQGLELRMFELKVRLGEVCNGITYETYETATNLAYPIFSNITNIGVPDVFDDYMFTEAQTYCTDRDIPFDFSWLKLNQNYTQFVYYKLNGDSYEFCSQSMFVSAGGDTAIVENSRFEECLRSYFE